MIYIFDGSMNGLLSCVFTFFQDKPQKVKISSELNYHPDIFETAVFIKTNEASAERVWKGVKKKLDKPWQTKIHKAFLSEHEVMFQHLFNMLCYVFSTTLDISGDYGNEDVLAVAQMAKKVNREKHRMEAFIRFEKDSNGMFFALVKPDFNVLPLIVRHFKNRYADQQWIIYDEHRKYGIYYDLVSVSEVRFEFNEHLPASDVVTYDAQESLYNQLWKDYFKSTNITERKNMKLHLRHVPKRYWRYLTEKK